MNHAARQASPSITNSRSPPKPMSIELVMPTNYLILPRPLLLLPSSFPASGSFPVSWLFTSAGQNIGAWASISVLPLNIKDWFPLGLTCLISLLSKGLPRVSFSTKIWKHQFFGAQTSLWFNSHIIHDYWKNHSFDYMETNMFTFILCVFHPSSLPSSFLRVSQWFLHCISL